jgi:hypothetical protein
VIFLQRMMLVTWMPESLYWMERQSQKMAGNCCRSRNERYFWSGTGSLKMCAKYKDSGDENLQGNLQHDNNCTHSRQILGRWYSAWCAQATNPTSSAMVLEQFTWSPQKSAKHCAREIGISRSRPHYDRDVRSCLSEILPDQWIGRWGNVEYPPRSPDLTPPRLLFVGVPEGCHT